MFECKLRKGRKKVGEGGLGSMPTDTESIAEGFCGFYHALFKFDSANTEHIRSRWISPSLLHHLLIIPHPYLTKLLNKAIFPQTPLVNISIIY